MPRARAQLWIAGEWVTLTGRLLSASPVEPSSGYRGQSTSSRPSPGKLSVRLRNHDAQLTPGNAASEWWPHIIDGAQIRFQVLHDETWHTRWVGHVDSWEPRSPGMDVTGIAVVEAQCSGVLERLSQGRPSLNPALQRSIMGENHVGRLRAYWPMTSGNDLQPSPLDGVDPMIVGGLRPASDSSLVSAGSVPSVSGGRAWGFSGLVPPGPARSWFCDWVLWPGDDSGIHRVMNVFVTDAGVITRWEVTISYLTGEGVLRAWSDTGIIESASDAHGGDILERWNWCQLAITQNSNSIDYLLRIFPIRPVAVDQQVADSEGVHITGTISGSSSDPTLAGAPTRVAHLDTTSPDEGLSMGHVQVGDIDLGTHILTPGDTPIRPDTAWVGETAGDRWERLCGEEMVTNRIIGTRDRSPQMGPQEARSFLDLLEECALVGGLFTEDRTASGLVFRTNESLHNQTAALVIPNAGLGEDPQPTRDTSETANEVTVSQPDGGSARLVDEADKARRGHYQDSYDVNVERSDQLPQHASWRLVHGTADDMRVESITVALDEQPGLVADWLALEPGDRVTVPDIPDVLFPGPVDLLAIGAGEEIGEARWRPKIVGKPARLWDAGTWDDTADPGSVGHGRWDTTSSEIDQAVDEAATSLTVIVLAGPLWVNSTDHPAELPLEVVAGGEVMEVTGISQATGDHDPAVGEADASSTVTATHVAPSVDAANSDGLLICSAASTSDSSGTYTVPSSMTEHVETNASTLSTMVDATEVLTASGPTGIREFDFSGTDAWSALSVVVHGDGATPTVEEQQADVAAASGAVPDIVFTTGPLSRGWWLLVLWAWQFDPASLMGPPNPDQDGWVLLAGTHPEPGSSIRSRSQAWARRISEDIDSETVTLQVTDDQIDAQHARLHVLSGVTAREQVFTVTRSVNDIAKSHPAGTAVEVAHPFRFASPGSHPYAAS